MNERRRSQSSEGHGVITVGSEGGGGGAEGGSARERNTKLTARCAGSSTLGAGELGAGPQPPHGPSGTGSWLILKQPWR